MVFHAENGGVGLNSRLKTNANQNSHRLKLSDSLVVRLLSAVFLYAVGLSNWVLFLFLAVKSGNFFKKPTEKENNDLAIAQDVLWNLSKQPIPGYNHQFFKARNGFQLHYICNQQEGVIGKDLIVFIHGFPNTCMTWRHLLKEPAMPTSNATIIALDMPGYGGSDSMTRYDTQVLEYLTEFIVAMREKYGTIGDSIGSTFVVGHDWGCVVAMRLAAEAPALADRFILSNGPLVELVKSNIERALTSSRRIFKQFQKSPRANFGCLVKSYKAVKPLLKQIVVSGYIFVFQLPAVFVKAIGERGNMSFLKAVYRSEHSTSQDEYKAQESMAANLGPSIAECKTQTKSGNKYGYSVAERIRSVGSMFHHSTAYYRDGLSTDPWEKSIETIAALYNIDSDMSSSSSPSRRRSSSASSPLFSDQQHKGSLRAPATILWGEDDLALTKAICLDGIGDYLAQESEVILFANGSHWIQVDRDTRMVLAKVIAMFACGNSKATPAYVAKEVLGWDAGATLMVKK